MNPKAKELWEEGVSVKTFKLVSEGVFHEQGQLVSVSIVAW